MFGRFASARFKFPNGLHEVLDRGHSCNIVSLERRGLHSQKKGSLLGYSESRKSDGYEKYGRAAISAFTRLAAIIHSVSNLATQPGQQETAIFSSGILETYPNLNIG